MFNNNPQQLVKAKLLLLYIIHNTGFSMSNSQLTQLVLENDIMDYFMLQQYLGELKGSNFIIEKSNNEEHILTITDMGKNTLNYFISHIPKSQIEYVDEILNVQKQKFAQSTQVVTDYIKLKNNEYLVKLKVTENDSPIINLELSVANDKQAREICEKWRNNASDFYSQIINMFIV